MNDRQTELKEHSAHIFEMGCMEQRVYLRNDADAVIEAKDAEIAKMNAKIEELESNERRLKRALWLDRAEKAYFVAMIIDHYPYTKVLHFTSRKRDESGKPLGVARTAMVWWNMFKEVERKCRAEAEKFK